MKSQKANISFSRVRDNELASSAQNIVNKMTGNPNFTDPQPTIETIQEATYAYSAALARSKDGSKEDTAIKNACLLGLETWLFTLGNYVNLIAVYDVVILESSGYPISKIPEPVGILAAPSLMVHYGQNPGEISVEMSPIAKASGYIVLYSTLPAPTDNAEWYDKLFSGAKGTLTHLKSETKYVFKAAAISPEANKMGLYNFSDSVEKLVPWSEKSVICKRILTFCRGL